MDRLMMISTDGHAGGRVDDYARYMPGSYLEAFREWKGHIHAALARIPRDTEAAGLLNVPSVFSEDMRNGWITNPKVIDGSRSGAWDPEVRLHELHGEGFVGEVIFPGPQVFECQIPFGGGLGMAAGAPPELAWVGHHAFNQWLADFVDPVMQAGIAQVPTLKDIDRIVQEIRWAAEAGLRGVQLPSDEDDVPLLYHERYGPVWEALVETNLTLVFHSGAGAVRSQDRNGVALQARGMSPESLALAVIEMHWHSHRPLWHLLIGLVFERFPTLRVIFTEAQADWVPRTLAYLDDRLTGSGAQRLSPLDELRRRMSLKPSEYWLRQCFVGASSCTASEMSMRHEIGLRTFTFGVDYPHIEGTWPNTLDWLRLICCEVPEDELRDVLGRNACRAFGFDEVELKRLANEYGATVADVLATRPCFADERIRWKVESAALSKAIARP
jgi:predicted TIM-barrel fold metal-dependent hydrolase